MIPTKETKTTMTNGEGKTPSAPNQDQPGKVIASMNPELRALYDRLKAFFQKQNLHTVRAYYRLGEMVRDFVKETTNDPRAEGRYGAYAARKLGQALGQDLQAAIYKAAEFVRTYNRPEMESLCQRQNKDGRPITWSHIYVLLGVSDRKLQQELLDRAMEECWTCVDLSHEVRKRVDREPARRGRPLAVPRTLHKAILQQESFADQFLARNSKVWEGAETCLTAKVEDTVPQRITEEVVAGLKATADKWRQVAEAAKERAEEAQEAYEKCRRILEANRKPRALPRPDPDGEKTAFPLASATVENLGPDASDSEDG
jgi:hypothetical protein